MEEEGTEESGRCDCHGDRGWLRHRLRRVLSRRPSTQATGGAPGLGMIAWIITGLASIAAALTFAEVAIMIPKTGGMVAYLEEIYNPVVGFLAGWVQTILFYPAMTSALAVVCAQQAALFIGDGFTVPLAIGIIILIIFK